MSSVIFKIYKEDNLSTFEKEYNFNLDITIIDIKKQILSDIYNNKFNSLDLENITERVYKDFGKLFFDKGLIPAIFDKYKLSAITNEDRVFLFVAKPKNVEIIVKKVEAPGFLKNMIKKELKKNNEFSFDSSEFPPL